ncbi:dnaJ homolog subfamily C member 3-like [Acanthaster planci]|uniref:DnaJ homolog subfamily C member 3-like n=1 Tax=Acanthaster planci TaxID=133434 RepID=A0A8B7YZF8_ACAPL|nr:dnaJ homolog subfamily C member 3-like [Acanthaster planci]
MINFNRFFSSLPLLLATLAVQYEEGRAESNSERLLKFGNSLLAQGQLADALAQFTSAIEKDPDNYMAYYKRATVYLAQGRSKAALPDLKKTMKLKPDFTSAFIHHGNILLKLGRMDEAKKDYIEALRQDPGNKEAKENLNVIPQLKQRLKDAESLVKAERYEEAVDYYSSIVSYVPWNVGFRQLRADAYVMYGNYYKAIDDYRAITKLKPDSTEEYFQMSHLFYILGDLEESLSSIRECLKLDQDHKDCYAHYKKVKKLDRQYTQGQNLINEERYDEAIQRYHQTMETEPEDAYVYHSRSKAKICHCYTKMQNTAQAYKICNEVLERESDNVDVLLDRGEAYLLDEMYDKALEDFRRANELEDSQRTQDGLNKAQKLLKQSQKRDYYKILGVKRTAKKREILKAYRKLAQQWHPDKHEDGVAKEKASKMFMDIAAAKEVLTDPEKRQQFDQGEDPLDPEEQQKRNQHWGNPFGGGFNPFGSGGGGFNFKFHFP